MSEVDLMNQMQNMQKDIEYIKKHMVDVDSIMTEDDYL